MKKIILEASPTETVLAKSVMIGTVIVKKDGEFLGMVRREEDGLIIAVDFEGGWTGHHATVYDLLLKSPELDFYLV